LEEVVVIEIIIGGAWDIVPYGLVALNLLTDGGRGKVNEFVVHPLEPDFRKGWFCQGHVGRS
jgi:hypothetical protein